MTSPNFVADTIKNQSSSEKPLTKSITVVLPIYNGVEMTKKCIETAILGIIDIPNAHFLLINDASSDTNMQPMLEKLKLKWSAHISLIENQSNLGSTLSFNKGMKYARKQDDIVFFNTDVIVPSNWLERLMNEAYTKSNIATVTPLSNNTTICTFPEFLQDNELPFGMDVNAVDAYFQKYELENIEAPSGIGFCMYIKRTCIDEIGYLDVKNFPRGYGEENDFCQRTIRHEWINVITPNIYVYHKGSASYGSERDLLMQNANNMMRKLHPNYQCDVQRFVESDPLKFARLCRYADLLQSASVTKILHVTHSLGGGTEQHIQELAQFCFDKNIASFLLISNVCGDQMTLRFGFKESADEINFNLPDQYDEIKHFFISLNLSGIHFHHIINYHPIIYNLPYDLAIDYIVTVHDFYWLGGNPTLTNEKMIFTGGYNEQLTYSPYKLPKNMTPESLREKLRLLLTNAKAIMFPSQSTERIFQDCFSISTPTLAYHLEQVRNVEALPKVFKKKRKYIIASLGVISREKGCDYLVDIVQKCLTKNSLFEFIILGHTSSKKLNKIVKATGVYQPKNLKNLIKEYRCDIFLFPARWPETYSYTLSYALESGLPIVAPNIGAFPERLSERKYVLIYNYSISPLTFIEQFENFIQALENGEMHPAPKFDGKIAQKNFYENYYPNIFIKNKNVKHHAQLLSSRYLNSFSIAPSVNHKKKYIKCRQIFRFFNKKFGKYLPVRLKRAMKIIIFGE